MLFWLVLTATIATILGILIGLATAGAIQEHNEQRRDDGALDTVRSTLSTVARERDHAHGLLRAISQAGAVPPDLQTSVNCAIARD